MNQTLMQIMYGAQKQSVKRNEAVVAFVEDYLHAGYPNVNFENRSDVISTIRDCLEGLMLEDACSIDQYRISDLLFLSIFLGSDIIDSISSGSAQNYVISTEDVGQNGKVLFTVVTSMESRTTGVIVDKTEPAWNIVEEIIKACPPAYRAEMPEDDALAAVLMSKAYWSAKG